MPNFSSHHGQILLSLEKVVKDLQPENLSGEEIRVRGGWLGTTGPYRGVSIFDMGEQEDDGTIGTQDIGYVCGIVFVEFDDNDAVLSGDQMMAWRELVRRRLTDQRIPVTMDSLSLPSEHVCNIISAGKNLSNPSKYPNVHIRQIVVAVWLRELATT